VATPALAVRAERGLDGGVQLGVDERLHDAVRARLVDQLADPDRVAEHLPDLRLTPQVPTRGAVPGVVQLAGDGHLRLALVGHLEHRLDDGDLSRARGQLAGAVCLLEPEAPRPTVHPASSG